VTATELRLNGDIGDMQILGTWMEQAAAELEISPATTMAVNLCLEELIVNIIHHGKLESGADPGINIQLHPLDDILELEIKDQRAPFNPLDHQPKRKTQKLEETTVGGLGIDLVKNYSSWMGYRRENGFNFLTLHFPLKTADKPS